MTTRPRPAAPLTRLEALRCILLRFAVARARGGDSVDDSDRVRVETRFASRPATRPVPPPAPSSPPRKRPLGSAVDNGRDAPMCLVLRGERSAGQVSDDDDRCLPHINPAHPPTCWSSPSATSPRGVVGARRCRCARKLLASARRVAEAPASGRRIPHRVNTATPVRLSPLPCRARRPPDYLPGLAVTSSHPKRGPCNPSPQPLSQRERGWPTIRWEPPPLAGNPSPFRERGRGEGLQPQRCWLPWSVLLSSRVAIRSASSTLAGSGRGAEASSSGPRAIVSTRTVPAGRIAASERDPDRR